MRTQVSRERRLSFSRCWWFADAHSLFDHPTFFSSLKTLLPGHQYRVSRTFLLLSRQSLLASECLLDATFPPQNPQLKTLAAPQVLQLVLMDWEAVRQGYAPFFITTNVAIIPKDVTIFRPTLQVKLVVNDVLMIADQISKHGMKLGIER